ncbi:MAG: cytochrome B6 [Arcobacter sp.]|nr:MAG: cytochrome B6 [Arcobacter sp.]
MLKAFFIFSLITVLFSEELITPIPLKVDYNIDKARLGEKLFNETRLSKDDTISCATCHILNGGGDNNIPVSFGVDGKKGIRNSPTVLNASFNTRQFWDGRAKNLEEQASGTIHNPIEMDSNFTEITKKLQQDPDYVEQFGLIYKDGITEKNIINAIVEYENTLITPNSKFDKFLRGDKNILSKDEKEGYKLFKEYGCISCHNGVNVGGNLMQKLGITEEYPTNDFGKFNITKKDEDKFYFKVPTLRNIQNTAPYFHDGRAESLRDSVDKMIFHQLGFTIEETEIDQIILFLNTLTGQTPFLEEVNK